MHASDIAATIASIGSSVSGVLYAIAAVIRALRGAPNSQSQRFARCGVG